VSAAGPFGYKVAYDPGRSWYDYPYFVSRSDGEGIGVYASLAAARRAVGRDQKKPRRRVPPPRETGRVIWEVPARSGDTMTP